MAGLLFVYQHAFTTDSILSCEINLRESGMKEKKRASLPTIFLGFISHFKKKKKFIVYLSFNLSFFSSLFPFLNFFFCFFNEEREKKVIEQFFANSFFFRSL